MEQQGTFHIERLTGKQILAIYEGAAQEHFPKEELKPTEIVKRLLEEKAYEGLGLFCGEELAGYALFARIPEGKVLLLDYYAVLTAFRNGGMGSFFLEQMKTFYGDRMAILLETEAPEQALTEEDRRLRIRRNEFYIRNGAVQTRVRSSLYGVAFGIFCIPLAEKPGDGQVLEELDAIYRYIFSGESYAKHVRIEIRE